MCYWYFDDEDFNEELEDEIIYRVRTDALLSLGEKKNLLICWWQEVEARKNGMVDLQSRVSARMKEQLASSGFATYEDLLSQSEPNA
jgi:hypothetical protein